MLNVAIIGASGYAGADLCGLVAGHKEFNLNGLYVSEQSADAGKLLSDLYPRLRGSVDMPLQPLTDEALEQLNERTQHRYMQAWLHENCRDYVANEDFGKKNGRRHYHAVIAKNTAIEPWKYGFYKLKKVKLSDESSVHKLSSYLLKLVNHANKLTTGKHFSKRGLKEVDILPF